MLVKPLREMNKQVYKADVLDWCQEVETQHCPDVDNMYKYIGFDIPVKHHRANVPCNRWRILRVYQHGQFVGYTDVGPFLSIDHRAHIHHIEMDYIGNAIDFDNGMPLILRGHEQACFWYCMYMLFFPDLNKPNGIDKTFWEEIVVNKENSFLVADRTSGRFRDYLENDKLQAIMCNMIPLPARTAMLEGKDIWSGVYEIEKKEEEVIMGLTVTQILAQLQAGNVTGLRRQQFVATQGQTKFQITDFILSTVYITLIDDTLQNPSLFTTLGQIITSNIPLNAGQTLTVYA